MLRSSEVLSYDCGIWYHPAWSLIQVFLFVLILQLRTPVLGTKLDDTCDFILCINE